MLSLTIDGRSVECPGGVTVLDAADSAEIYIPRLCHHPDLPPAGDVVLARAAYQGDVCIAGEHAGESAGDRGHCNLCLVEVEGQPEPVRACTLAVQEGLVIRITSDELSRRRQDALRTILTNHPHACLTCAQKQGCSRSQCSANVAVEERCCPLLGHCELERVADFVGISADTPRYLPPGRPVIKGEPLFDRDFNLCIGCLRCVRACADLRGVDILAGVWHDERTRMGTRLQGGLIEAECRLCGACVEVCPTGALLDNETSAPLTGAAAVPCMRACPLGIDIPGYVRLIAQGRHGDALDLIRFHTPFPAILGYVCFHPCEDACRRGNVDEPVAICALKRFAADEAGPEEMPVPSVAPDTGKRVAVIGSGPAGLTAAYDLRRLGHAIDVFDEAAKPGGMLRQAIPKYRLPEEVLDRELGVLDRMGIHMHMNRRMSGCELESAGYDAVLLAAGMAQSKTLVIDGSDLAGILSGLPFLRSARARHEPHLDGSVVVIGGGNVAVDAAMTAWRLGAAEVHLVCLESRATMPAHDGEVAQAEAEGVQIHTGWGPRRFVGVDGHVSGLEMVCCTRVFDELGAFKPEFDEAETMHLPVRYAIVTIGQQVDAHVFAEYEGVKPSAAGTVAVDQDLSSGRSGTFAAGDMVHGPTSVVEAMAEGRKAAEAIHRYLGGQGGLDAEPATKVPIDTRLDYARDTMRRVRQEIPSRDPATRRLTFAPIETTLPGQQAKLEAERCLRCHLRQTITAVTLPPELWLAFERSVIEAVPEAEGVYQLLDADKQVIGITGAANLRAGLLQSLDSRAAAAYFVWETDPMYTKRESELLQQHLQAHGELPGGGAGGDDLEDLF